MDDLSGLSWSAGTTNPSQPPTSSTQSSLYQTLRPTPSPLASGRNTPLSIQGSGGIGAKPQQPQQPPKPAQDHFSNLVNFGSAKSTANLSLRERQERLEAEKKKKEEEKRKQFDAQFGNGQFWDSLSQKPSANNSRTASPAVPTLASLSAAQSAKKSNDDADLFAAFKAETKVDNASFYPPPTGSNPASGKATPSAGIDLSSPSAWNQPALSGGGGFVDDDPFGLNNLKPASQPVVSQPVAAIDDDDDFLGDLGKPVEEVKKKQAVQQSSTRPEPGKPIEDDESDSDDSDDVNVDDLDPFKKAVAQLVELGFTADNARRGLTESGGGLNVQAAAGWLLDDAEKQARQKAKARAGKSGDAPKQERPGRGQSGTAWMQDATTRSESSNRGEPEFSKTAAAVGASFLKGAGSLWKTGQKKMQQAVSEFQQEGDPNQPKWMRAAAQQGGNDGSVQKAKVDVTDEALMLEGGIRPGRKPAKPPAADPRHQPSPMPSSRDHSPFSSSSAARSSPVPKWQQGPQPPTARLDPKARLSKFSQDDGAQAYISPARRKKLSPQPQATQQSRPPPSVPQPDLLNTAALPSRPKTVPNRPIQSSPAARSSTQPPSRTITPRPTVPPRQVPSISPAALQTSHKERADGTVHFKRGDYAAAHASYTNSLSAVPQTHPIAILLLTNRALTALKTGEPRQAIDDADRALKIIGAGGGVGETIAVDNGDTKDMRDLYGKALSRKAEALEQLEKWADAGTVWQLCVEAGLGGPNAIAGKQRCQKALAPKSKANTPQVSRAATPRPKPKPKSALADLAPSKDSEAVERLRAANKAAEAADDEKFALADQVDARIAAWRDGKRDNLRALLGSLDNVLWASSGWKKVGMHELVMANRVKIVYMKAIAKCHPDKLPQDANTEIKLIAGTVFATLNESWDKFKSENGL